MMIGFQK